MKIETRIIQGSKGAIDRKDIREHLRAVCFDFDADCNKLSIIGTNAQVMIVNTIIIKDESDITFCKKYFSDNSAYFFDNVVFDKRDIFAEFNEIDGQLACNGTILKRLEQSYPNWKCVVPHEKMKKASIYCGFNADLIKQIDKALGWKFMIITHTPCVSGNLDANDERLSPHRWDLNIYDNCDTIVVCMPMRLD